ncbi:MAG: transcriptional regulator, AbrB family [Herbinix sp.]|jgi:transcriptional pleiotropic regulator of transition state genes|nr:transcriptional regulator, AbrB family [Herbinix sp.]
MAKGIVRKIDELGRITLPMEFRRSFGIKVKEQAPIGMYIVDGEIHLVKVEGEFRGIARNLDELGRLTLPIEVRRSLNFTDRQKVDMYVEFGQIIVKKVGCEWCSSEEDLMEIDGHCLCRKCAFKVVDTVMEA